MLVVKDYLLNIYPNIELVVLDDSARTAQDAANSLNQDVGSIVKSLLFKNTDNDYFLCLVSGDKYLSIDKLSKITGCKILKAGADEVKTQTGFSIGGATIEDVKLMRETVGDEMGVKASGGIKTLADVKVMVDAGANRIGTSSSISIIHE